MRWFKRILVGFLAIIGWLVITWIVVAIVMVTLGTFLFGPDNPASGILLLPTLILMVTIGLRLIIPRLTHRPEPLTNTCQRCDYDLRGTDSDTCPECGQPISALQQEYLSERYRQS